MNIFLHMELCAVTFNLTKEDLALANMVVSVVIKSLAFLLGYLTIRLGYRLVRDGVTGNFKFNSEVKGYKAALESGSPGLLFVLLGTAMVIYAMIYKVESKLDPDIKTIQTTSSAGQAKKIVKDSSIDIGNIDTSSTIKK